MIIEKAYQAQGIKLHYYELKNDCQPLVLLHAQGTDASSFENVWKPLSKQYHVFSVDCFGHGGSLHDPAQYRLAAIGGALIRFLEDVTGGGVYLLGHSSGGLAAAYAAAKSSLCRCLILEDPPFFSSQGERRKQSYNFVDLSTACHRFLNQSVCQDFVLYYFANQYAWNFFPEKSREKIRGKMTSLAERYREKHPSQNLKVPFWPRAALAAFHGMNTYDPQFGEAFYNDSFHSGISHESLLKEIPCRTVFLKAKTSSGTDGLLMAALNEEDLERVSKLVADLQIVRFDCGHGIHIEKPREFIKCILSLT